MSPPSLSCTTSSSSLNIFADRAAIAAGGIRSETALTLTCNGGCLAGDFGVRAVAVMPMKILEALTKPNLSKTASFALIVSNRVCSYSLI